MALIQVQKNGTTMQIDSANLSTWTGAGWQPVGSQQQAPAPQQAQQSYQQQYQQALPPQVNQPQPAYQAPQPQYQAPQPQYQAPQQQLQYGGSVDLAKYGFQQTEYGWRAPGGDQAAIQKMNEDYDDLKPIYASGPSNSIVLVGFTGSVIPKATMVDAQGNRVVVRTDNRPGKYRTMAEMAGQGFQAEKAPGVSLSNSQYNVGGGLDLALKPNLTLPNGQTISASDPNYAAYAALPGVQKAAVAAPSYQQPDYYKPYVPQPTAPDQDPSTYSSYSAPALPSGSSFNGQSLVKFSTDPNGAAEGDASTVWLVDPKTSSLRPFMSEQAFNNYFGNNPQAWSSIQTIGVDQLGDSGALKGFKVLDHNYGVQNDGSVLNASHNPSAILSNYGQQKNDATTQQAIDFVKAIKLNLNAMVSNGDIKGIKQADLDAVFNDSGQLARLINAMAYGKYDATDITKEAIRLAAVKGGNTSLSNLKVIDDTRPKSDYSGTQEYKTASGNPSLFLPQNAADKLMQATTSPEMFQKGIQQSMISSPEFKAQLDQIQSTYYDILNQQLSANTERERQVAQYNWDNFKESLSKNFNVKLANNAADAWDQVSNLDKQAAGQGIQGSGIYNEMVDTYLKKVRAGDQVERTSKLNQAEANEAAFYQTSASPDQIKKLVEADKASGLPQDQWKSVKFGLLPSQDVQSQFNVDTLYNKLKQDPAMKDLGDWEIKLAAQNLHDAALDENGNYRSKTYTNYIVAKQANDKTALQAKESSLLQNSVLANDKIFSQYQDVRDPSNPDFFSQPTSSSFSSAASQFPTTPASTLPTGYTAPASTSYSPTGQTYTPTDSALKSLPSGWTLDSSGHPVPPSSPSTQQQPQQNAGSSVTSAAQAASKISSNLSGGSSSQTAPISPIGSTSTTPKKATLYGPNGQKFVVDVGSSYASSLQSKGWGLTQGSYKKPTI